MPDLNISFGGQTLVIPDAYYQDNVSAALPNEPPATPPLIFLGYGFGQKPQTAETYTNPQDLLNAIRGGPCSGYVPFLANPSPVLSGAQQITYINVGSNTQSSLTLYSASSGVVDLTSADYGTPSNLLQAMVQSGTSAGKKLTLYDGYANITQAGDNLGVPFQLAYTGAATGVTYTVTTSGGVATTFSTSSSIAGESVSVSLVSGGFDTVTSLVEYLNGTGFYSAVALSATNGQLPSNQLDAASAISLPVPTLGAYNYENVTATLTDVLYWVNQFASTLATAALHSGAISRPNEAPSTLPLTPFTGATSVPPVNNDYATGFNLALKQPGWAVFADSNASAVRALLDQHCETASLVSNGKWRRGFTGSSIGDTIQEATAAARSSAAITTTYVYPGIYRTDTNTGANVLYSGLYAAAAAAGMATGNPVATPLTNKALISNGVEVDLSQSEVNQLQMGGVMPIWKSPQTGLATIVSDLTTWQSDANPENVFNQQVACRWFLAYSLVNATRAYVGTIASPKDEAKILNSVKGTLNALIYSPGNPNGVIATWDPNSLVLNYFGGQQLAAVQVNVVLVGQNRFITILANIQPLNLTVAAVQAAA